MKIEEFVQNVRDFLFGDHKGDLDRAFERVDASLIEMRKAVRERENDNRNSKEH